MNEKLKWVGTVHSELKALEDCPLLEHEGAPKAILEIFDDYTLALTNITPGSKIIVLTWLHRADRTVLKTKPRNNPDAKLTGVFSTRSPDRPNPIGIHFVRVTGILEDNKIQVEGLEVLDQTPVIDIKPDLG